MPQISASIKPETIKAIKKQAKDEHRTFSAMVAVMLSKASEKITESFEVGYAKGYSDATKEACNEIAKNYQPNK